MTEEFPSIYSELEKEQNILLAMRAQNILVFTLG